MSFSEEYHLFKYTSCLYIIFLLKSLNQSTGHVSRYHKLMISSNRMYFSIKLEYLLQTWATEQNNSVNSFLAVWRPASDCAVNHLSLEQVFLKHRLSFYKETSCFLTYEATTQWLQIRLFSFFFSWSERASAEFSIGIVKEVRRGRIALIFLFN